MSRRLRQGLGRIARKKEDFGIAITLFDFNCINKTTQKKLFADIEIQRSSSYKAVIILHKIFVDKQDSFKLAIE